MNTPLYKLYLNGNNPKSVKDLTCIQHFLDLECKKDYILEVIDVFQKPELAEKDNILFTPTLVKIFPLPEQKFIGDFSFHEKVFNCLNSFEDQTG